MTPTSEDLRRYWANLDAAEEALRADAETWAEYQWARQSWNKALSHAPRPDAATGAGEGPGTGSTR